MAKYNILTQEDSIIGFNTNNWTNPPSTNSDGTVTTSNVLTTYRTLLPNKNFILNIELDSTGHNCTVTARVPTGYMAMTTGTNTLLVQYDTENGVPTETSRKTVDPFTSTTIGINTLTIQRMNNTITFKYKSPNGTTVTESRTYENLTAFPFSLWTNSTQEVTVRSITILEEMED